jgi:uncharacterized protein YjbI with pentapeptide repeats
MRAPVAFLVAAVILASPPLPVGADEGYTQIAGQPYRLVPIEEFVNRLVEPHRQTVHYRATAFTGALLSSRLKSHVIDCVIDLEGVRFLGPVAFDGVVFADTVRMHNTVFEGGLSLQGTRFVEEADFTGLRAHTHANFKRAVFLGSAIFAGAQVEELGSFIGTHFTGTSTFSHARFGKTVFFEEAVFDGTADFASVNFEGISSFRDANFSGATSFAGGRFKGRADFLGARFRDTVNFDQAMFSALVFDRVQVGGEASFQRATFIHPARFAHTIFRAAVSFAGSIFLHHADFSSARFDGTFDLASHLDRTLDLRHSSGPALDMLLPPWQESVVRREQVFSDSARVLLQDAHYDRILVRWSDLAGRLATAQDEDDLDALYSVYAGLRAQFLTQGQQQDATASHVEWLERRRMQLGWAQAEWYWLQLRRVTTGYGTDLWQFACFAVTGILLFAGLYRLLYARLRAQLPQRMAPSLGCLCLSLTTFLRLLPAAPQSRSPAYAIIIAQSVFAWICWGLFIATLLDLSL